MARKIIGVILLMTVGFIAVVWFRTATYGPPKMAEISGATVFDVDETIAARNLSGAVKIKTISHSRETPPDAAAFGEFHNYLLTTFPNVHSNLTRETIAELSLLYTWEGSNQNLDPILYSAHMDVVPVEPGTEDAWTHPAFSGEIADGYIWGRGTLDMKQSLIAYMHATELLVEQGFQPERTIYFAFGHDEEVGSHAAKEIAEIMNSRGVKLYYTLDEGLVITDGIVPGIAKPVALIGTAEKGYVTLELIATGPGGHASLPPANPLNTRLARALVAINDNQLPSRLQPPASQMFEYLAPDLSLANRIILANRWFTERLLLSRLSKSPATNAQINTTFAPTVLESGFKDNVLSQSGRAVLNIRILPGETVDRIIGHVRGLIDDPEITVRITGNEPSDPAAISDVNSSSFIELQKTIHQVFPDVASAPALLVGRTDSRRYAELTENRYRFLPSRLTSQDLSRIHGTDERISVGNFAEIVRFYGQLMLNTAGG